MPWGALDMEWVFVNHPGEFLNKLSPSGVPPHRLALKKGIPVMLMRNIDPSGGLCNGTRLIIKEMLRNIIVADIITGEFSGKTVFISRIPIIPTDYPFEFKRTQFPIKPCYAMTINKSQGMKGFNTSQTKTTSTLFTYNTLIITSYDFFLF